MSSQLVGKKTRLALTEQLYKAMNLWNSQCKVILCGLFETIAGGPVMDELVTQDAHALVQRDLMRGRRALGMWVLSSGPLPVVTREVATSHAFLATAFVPGG